MINRKGIDISKHQGQFNSLYKIRGDYDFCIMRAGISSRSNDKLVCNEDYCFSPFYADCIGNHIDCGCYYYSKALTVAEAKQEAEYLLKLLDGKKFTYPIWLDLEDSSQANLDKRLLTDIAKTFMDTVQAKGYYVGLYSNKNWLTYKLVTGELISYDLWLAEWKDNPTYQGNFGMWQKGIVKYDKQKGAGVPGFACDVDLDFAYKDYPSIICNAGLNGFNKGDKSPNPDRHPERSERIEDIPEEKPVEEIPQEQPQEDKPAESLTEKLIDILKYALNKLEG